MTALGTALRALHAADATCRRRQRARLFGAVLFDVRCQLEGLHRRAADAAGALLVASRRSCLQGVLEGVLEVRRGGGCGKAALGPEPKAANATAAAAQSTLECRGARLLQKGSK